MEIINFKVEKQVISCSRKNLVSDTIKAYQCRFSFDSEWNDYSKTAVFLKGNNSVQVILDSNNECILPKEAVASTGDLYIGVFGTGSGKRYPTIYTPRLYVAKGCESGSEPVDPTPNVYDQLLAKYLEQIQAVATEKARAEGIESNLATALLQEATNRGNKDTQLENAIASEKQRAIARENEIEARIPSHDNFATKEDVLNEKARAEGAEANKVDKEEGKGLFSGDYNDLTNKPTIPTVPTNVSAFTNDAGYLTEHQSLDGYATETWVENKGYVTNAYHDSTKQDVLTQQDKQAIADLKDISGKVDKVDGKGLSSNDFTDDDKQDISTLKQTIVNKQDDVGFSVVNGQLCITYVKENN